MNFEFNKKLKDVWIESDLIGQQYKFFNPTIELKQYLKEKVPTCKEIITQKDQQIFQLE